MCPIGDKERQLSSCITIWDKNCHQRLESSLGCGHWFSSHSGTVLTASVVTAGVVSWAHPLLHAGSTRVPDTPRQLFLFYQAVFPHPCV